MLGHAEQCSAVFAQSEVADVRRRAATHGAFDDGSSAESSGHSSSSFAAAATLLHLLQPDKFGVGTAAAACAAFAAPFVKVAATEPASRDSAQLAAADVHRAMAIEHFERLRAALNVPSFPAAVAAECPAALAALFTACARTLHEVAVAAFEPAALEVIAGLLTDLGYALCKYSCLQSAWHTRIAGRSP